MLKADKCLKFATESRLTRVQELKQAGLLLSEKNMYVPNECYNLNWNSCGRCDLEGIDLH